MHGSATHRKDETILLALFLDRNLCTLRTTIRLRAEKMPVCMESEHFQRRRFVRRWKGAAQLFQILFGELHRERSMVFLYMR
jgi:hypothetical protein